MRVLHDECQPLFWIRWIQGKVGAAGLLDSKQADNHLDRALYTNPNDGVGAYAKLAQVSCELIGAGIELRVVDLVFSPSSE